MPTLRERIRKAAQSLNRLGGWLQWKAQARLAPRSYAVKDASGDFFFIEAGRFAVRKGRLLFWRYGRLISVVEADKWERVIDGITMGDFEEKHG